MPTKIKVYDRIEDSGAAYSKVESDEVTAGLGATVGTKAPASALRHPAMAEVQLHLAGALVSTGGRPTRQGAIVNRRVPLTAREARALDQVTTAIRESGVSVTSGQLAGALLQQTLGAILTAPPHSPGVTPSERDTH